MKRAVIHQRETSTERTTILARVVRAFRQSVSPKPQMAKGSHRTAAKPAKSMELALTDPAVAATRAKMAGCRQLPERTPRMVRPIIQGSAAQAIRMADVRASYSRTYGLSM